MTKLEPPWSGLMRVAATVDLWGIVSTLGGPEAAAGASPARWVEAGLPPAHAWRVEAPALAGPWIAPTTAGWPEGLVGVPYGPVALAVEGEAARLRAPGVAIVGSRACTPYGQGVARRLAVAVVDAGGVVVSGMARGIDEAAQVAARGVTVAVLGQGLAAPSVGAQGALRRQLLRAGACVVSEFPPEQGADRWTFPVRNRVIAALARVVVVVEAGTRSGARSTAAHGLRMGREVMAVPGPLGAPASEGCLDLIQEGATVVRCEANVLAAARIQPASDPILGAVGAGATADEVVARSGLPPSVVFAGLGRLLAARRLARAPGARYVPA